MSLWELSLSPPVEAAEGSMAHNNGWNGADRMASTTQIIVCGVQRRCSHSEIMFIQYFNQ
jgi:hypothetical protein